MGIHAADDATSSFVYRHSQPPALTSTNGFAGPNARTGQSRDHEGQALLGSQASARQSLTARRSRAVDRSRERHGWSIGVRVRPHRAPHGASLPVGRSVFELGRPETGRYPLTIGIENPRRSEPKERFLQRRCAEARIVGVRQPPRQNRSAGPVDDHHQIEEAACHRDEGHVGRPHVVRLDNLQAAQQVGYILCPGAALLVPGRGTSASIPITRISRRTRLRLTRRPSLLSSKVICREP